MKGKDKAQKSAAWSRRSVLLSLAAGIGAVAAFGRKRLSFKGRTSLKTADYWEKTK